MHVALRVRVPSAYSALGTRAIGGQAMELARVSALEYDGCMSDLVVSCGTATCCIVQVEVQVEVTHTKVMDELQRILGGSAVSLEFDWHEDEAIGVALAELLLSVLQVVAQPLMLGRVPNISGCLAYPWLVAVTTRTGDGDVKLAKTSITPGIRICAAMICML